ncbi:YlzJ-like family protein [Metabacillus iocasae]|nr:YlzJ-like family protein [Metabacillus iocasae]
MPQEHIFPMESTAYENQQTIEYNGISFVVMENAQKQYQIVRMLSTNPQDYLNSEYIPGQILSL